MIQDNVLRLYKSNLTMSEAQKLIEAIEAIGYNFSHFERGEMVFVRS